MKTNITAQDNTNAVFGTFDLQRFAESEATTSTTANTATETTTANAETTTSNEATSSTTTGTQTTNEATKQTATATSAPETYAAFTLPDGFDMDQEALAEFMPLAKELGMTQDAAQKAIGLHTKAIGAIMGRMEAHRDEAYTELMTQIKADQTIGGAKYEANLGKINSVLNKFGGEGSSDIFHAAVAQIAAVDPVKAKAMYSTLHAIAKAASVDNSLILGMPRKANESEPYPDLPNSRK